MPPFVIALYADGDLSRKNLFHSAENTCFEVFEDTPHTFEFESSCELELFVDDVHIPKSTQGKRSWTPWFFAGKVNAVIEYGQKSHSFWLQVSPSAKKLEAIQFEKMLGEVRDFEPSLLVGSSPGSTTSGREQKQTRLENMVRLARLRKHGDLFLNAIDAVESNPHSMLQPVVGEVPLFRAKKLDVSTRRNFSLLMALKSGAPNHERLENIVVRSRMPLVSLDTPANRALNSLLRRFKAAVSEMEWRVNQLALPSSAKDEELKRRERRIGHLRSLLGGAERRLKSKLMRSVSRAEVSSSGLTQIAADPKYGRAYTLGISALRTGVHGTNLVDEISLGPSWGVYETWCFARVLKLVEKVVDSKPVVCKTSIGTCDFSYMVKLDATTSMEILFQACFPSESPSKNKAAWSISRERRPDIVLVISSQTEMKYYVLDAKYRSGRDNVLSAMESAHIYHDSLRIGPIPPCKCLLLLPGSTSVSSLETEEYRIAHGVGALSNFSSDSDGEGKLELLLRSWIKHFNAFSQDSLKVI